MSAAAADLVICGQVVVSASPGGLETAEAVAIADGRVASVGTRREVTDAVGRGAHVVDVGRTAIVPGLHDFHIHLVGLARARAGVALDDAANGADVARRLARAAALLPPRAWLTGRGWSEAQLATVNPDELDAAIGERLAFVSSHDGHSAWASAPALRLAGVTSDTSDPAGGRIERDAAGAPTGVLRETAMDLVAAFVPEAQGAALRDPLDATLRELAAFGLTGASEAGDYTADGGIGADAALGDSFSSLTDLADLVDGRLRMNLGIPVDAIAAAAGAGLRTAASLPGRRSLRFGWAKEYADGALGSGTAALFEPATCGTRDAGILRVSSEELDALARAPGRLSDSPDDRLEHAQLLRADEVARFAQLGMTASVQPIHAAADRDLVESCWGDRQDRAYAWRSLVDAGARLAAGSDAPFEAVNPWLGIFAAVHRRLPSDPRSDWRTAQALSVEEALMAYTLGPAAAIGALDEGHLRAGARADLAVLSVDLDTILAADGRLADVRSVLTMVDGQEVPLA